MWEGPTRSAKILQRVHNETISYENALLSFGGSINLTSRESVSALGKLIKSIHEIFWGGSWNVWGEALPPPPPLLLMTLAAIVTLLKN